MRLREDLLHEQNAIEFYIRHHRNGKAEEMLTQMPEYQELLKPYFKVLSEELYEWQNSQYNHSNKYPEQLKHKTASNNNIRNIRKTIRDRNRRECYKRILVVKY